MVSLVYSKNDECIMSEQEQEIIVNWLRDNYLRLKSNGYNRYMKSMYDIPDIPKIVWDIRQRIVDKENLHDAIQEPKFKDSIGYMLDGGQLHEHQDPNNYGLIHTRFNVYVQIPEKGGYPVYNGHIYKLKERTYICCKAGIEPHYCEKVEGKRERIILSYGFLLPIELIQKIKYDYDYE